MARKDVRKGGNEGKWLIEGDAKKWGSHLLLFGLLPSSALRLLVPNTLLLKELVCTPVHIRLTAAHASGSFQKAVQRIGVYVADGFAEIFLGPGLGRTGFCEGAGLGVGGVFVVFSEEVVDFLSVVGGGVSMVVVWR